MFKLMQTEQSGLTTLTLPVHHQPVVIPNQNIMKICIVLNGTLSNSEAFQHQIKQFDNVIAADGGANKCFEFGIVPDYIIGDFDSATKVHKLLMLQARVRWIFRKLSGWRKVFFRVRIFSMV